jgi:hypothetical protein
MAKAQQGRKYAQVIDGKVRWLFDAEALPEWKDDAFLVVDVTEMDHPKEGDAWTGTAFTRPTAPMVVPQKSEAQRIVEAIIGEPEALAALVAAVDEAKGQQVKPGGKQS